VSKPFRIWKKGFCHEVVDIDIGWLVGWLVGWPAVQCTNFMYIRPGRRTASASAQALDLRPSLPI